MKTLFLINTDLVIRLSGHCVLCVTVTIKKCVKDHTCICKSIGFKTYFYFPFSLTDNGAFVLVNPHVPCDAYGQFGNTYRLQHHGNYISFSL